MKIEVNGTEVNAYRLITQKKFAKEIAEGKKTVEIRDFTDFYHNLFIDANKMNEFNKYMESPDGTMHFDDVIKDTRFVRFTNYSGSWLVDAEIYLPHICSVCQEDIDFLKSNYNFSDMDEDVKKYEDLPFEEKPMFFALPIKRVIKIVNV